MCKAPPVTSLKIILISEFSKVGKEAISITKCQMSAYLEHKEMHEFAVRGTDVKIDVQTVMTAYDIATFTEKNNTSMGKTGQITASSCITQKDKIKFMNHQLKSYFFNAVLRI